MISVSSESLIPLRDVPKYLPKRPNGKRLHISAVYRWMSHGVGGVVLETVRVGGTTYTSVEALQRFAEHLTRPSLFSPEPLPVPRKAHTHERAVRLELERELGLAGSIC